MTEVANNISWDMLDMKEKVNALQKLNSSMPTQLIEDLVKMYDELNDEQKQEMENNLNDPDLHYKTEKLPDEIVDAVSIIPFDTVEESDAFLVKEGKLTQEELDAEKPENKIFEIPEDYTFDSNDFDKYLDTKDYTTNSIDFNKPLELENK